MKVFNNSYNLFSNPITFWNQGILQPVIGNYYQATYEEASVGDVSSSELYSGNGQYLFGFVTNLNHPNLNRLEPTVYTCDANFNVNTINNVQTKIYFKLYQRQIDGTENLLCTSNKSDFLKLINTEYKLKATIPTKINILDTDRILVKWYANITGSSGPVTVTCFVGGVNDSSAGLPIPLNNINDLFSASLPLIYSDNNFSLGYNSANLKLTENQLDTIQDISTTSSPTFANLTDSALTATYIPLAGTGGLLGNSPITWNGSLLNMAGDVNFDVSTNGFTLRKYGYLDFNARAFGNSAAGHNYYPLFNFSRSGSDTLGTIATTLDGDYIFQIAALGVNTANVYAAGASITVKQNGNANTARIPADMIFQVYDRVNVSHQINLRYTGNMEFPETNQTLSFGASNQFGISFDGTYVRFTTANDIIQTGNSLYQASNLCGVNNGSRLENVFGDGTYPALTGFSYGNGTGTNVGLGLGAFRGTNNIGLLIYAGYPPVGANNYAIKSLCLAQSSIMGTLAIGAASITGTSQLYVNGDIKVPIYNKLIINDGPEQSNIREFDFGGVYTGTTGILIEPANAGVKISNRLCIGADFPVSGLQLYVAGVSILDGSVGVGGKPNRNLEIVGAATADGAGLRLSNIANQPYFWDIWRDNTTGDLNIGYALGGTITKKITINSSGEIFLNLPSSPGTAGSLYMGGDNYVLVA
jgi:hypothetical protein